MTPIKISESATIGEIESAISDITSSPKFQLALIEYNRLLSIMGNVEGDEVFALALVAVGSAYTKDVGI